MIMNGILQRYVAFSSMAPMMCGIPLVREEMAWNRVLRAAAFHRASTPISGLNWAADRRGPAYVAGDQESLARDGGACGLAQ